MCGVCVGGCVHVRVCVAVVCELCVRVWVWCGSCRAVVGCRGVCGEMYDVVGVSVVCRVVGCRWVWGEMYDVVGVRSGCVGFEVWGEVGAACMTKSLCACAVQMCVG